MASTSGQNEIVAELNRQENEASVELKKGSDKLASCLLVSTTGSAFLFNAISIFINKESWVPDSKIDPLTSVSFFVLSFSSLLGLSYGAMLISEAAEHASKYFKKRLAISELSRRLDTDGFLAYCYRDRRNSDSEQINKNLGRRVL